MSFEIANRYTRAVLFSSTVANNAKAAVVEAVNVGTDLSDANLRGADLSDTNLRGANLRGADLSDANLRGANLSGADLSDTDLRGANLRGADLSDANLSDANLRGANLSGADLSDANLRGADLSDTNLRGANLTPIRDDLWAVLCSVPAEVRALRAALLEGRVDGSAYEGDCACLVGTIANARHCKYTDVPGLAPNSSRPAERFFLAISKGDTPDNSQYCKQVVEWIDEFSANMQAAFGAKP